MSQESPGDKSVTADDPNLSIAGARQRRGPFWMEEPSWFLFLSLLVFGAGLVLFLVAVGFDRP